MTRFSRDAFAVLIFSSFFSLSGLAEPSRPGTEPLSKLDLERRAEVLREVMRGYQNENGESIRRLPYGNLRELKPLPFGMYSEFSEMHHGLGRRGELLDRMRAAFHKRGDESV